MQHENPIGAALREPQPPRTLQLGDFTIEVEQFSENGQWDPMNERFRGVSGIAWLSFDCAEIPAAIVDLSSLGGSPNILHHLEVVTRVVNPQTQISLTTAQRIRPTIQLGQTLALEATLSPNVFRELVQYGAGLADWLERNPRKGQALVRFEKVTIIRTGRSNGRIVEGSAVYPTRPHVPTQLRLSVADFTLILHSLILTPDSATANIDVQLPGGLVDRDTCNPAILKLGDIPITPRCTLYVDTPAGSFGPWIVGDSGLVIDGTGYTFDLSLQDSPMAKLPGWRGLVLNNGQASGADLVPNPANIGYLRGEFNFHNAELTGEGLDAYLTLRQQHSFQALNPLGYSLTLDSGWLQVVDSRVWSGEFGPGRIDLPALAVCDGSSANPITVAFNQLIVDKTLNLAGEIQCGSGLQLSWGELTHPGSEVVIFGVEAHQGFLYLPSDPLSSFFPVDTSGFIKLSLTSASDVSLQQIQLNGLTGLIVRELHNLQIFSPDRQGGFFNPIRLSDLGYETWLRIGSQGVDGELTTYYALEHEQLGNPARPAYVGNTPFQGALFSLDKLNVVTQYIDSAVYGSDIDGYLVIPEPCKIEKLIYRDMHLTSTAHLVGGDVKLPVSGVELDYWKLKLVPTEKPEQAGVVSVRTGRIVFTAAGISEPIHFKRPFRLTWGEMLADGNLGELFFDYNNYGQCFDDIPYAPHRIMLSSYTPGSTDAYLATCGMVHFNFFGPQFVNLRDARYHIAADPYFSRYTTAPKMSDIGNKLTDLHLTKTWDDLTGDVLSSFDFPDATMDYHIAAQKGFIGNGTSGLSFLHFDGLSSTIEIHHDAIDIRLSSYATHDLDVGLFMRVGVLSEIHGCARIEGPLLNRISMHGLFEQSAATGAGILSPKVGCVVDVNLTSTPNSLDFTASGDLLLQVAGAAVDLSASVHLLFDWGVGSAEGEVIGHIDCNTIIGGLEGEGQITWHVGPDMQYLQGRMKVHLCNWIGSGGMEGGLFIGHEVPRSLAWVLHTDSEHFGVSDAILPAKLTGLFGYGRLSFSINWYILGGGVELYAGMGAFSESPAGLVGVWTSDWSSIPGLGLPYVIGSCGIYVHGEILGGLVSASAWAALQLRGPVPIYFEGSFGLEGCVLWVICASIGVTAGFNSHGFYLA